jgi:hypothetical protein
MNTLQKTAAVAATLALMLPGAAIAKHGTPGSSGKAGAPGQVCKSLKVKGHKTAEQRAAYKKCVKDAVAKRKAEHAAAQQNKPADTDTGAPEADDDAPATTAPAAPTS